MDIERILELASTVKLQMDVLQRRVQGKPGHQGITLSEILANTRYHLDQIDDELTRADQDHLWDQSEFSAEDAENMAAEAADKAARRKP